MLRLQNFIENLILSFLSVIKVIILSDFFVKPFKPNPSKDNELIILGNGPSLRTSLIEHEIYFHNKTLMCVNGFAFSEEYKVLKPKYYVIGALEFWMDIPPSEAHIPMRKQVFDNIEKYTDWDLHIFVSAHAKRSKYWKTLFKTNPNINIHYYNPTPVEGFKWLTHFMYKHNLGMMRPHNVLGPSIFLGLNMNYKKNIIFGADHSWHEELKVDENNHLIVNHEHFFDKGKVMKLMFKDVATEFKVHDLFRKLYLSFKGYFLLVDYANSKNAEILNASHKSYIDAFPKIKIN